MLCKKKYKESEKQKNILYKKTLISLYDTNYTGSLPFQITKYVTTLKYNQPYIRSEFYEKKLLR